MKTVNHGASAGVTMGAGMAYNTQSQVKVRDVNRKAKQLLTQYLNKGDFDKIFDKLYNVGKVNNTSIEPVIKNIAANLNKINN
jgi:GH24 family phage-related lysozyme (muramidase)